VERPPRFRPDEVVRIMSAAPGEDEYLDGRFRLVDSDEWAGRDGVVWFAHPAGDHRSWRIVFETLYLRNGVPFSVLDRARDDLSEEVYSTVLDVAEEALDSTGLVEQWGAEGEGPPRYVPLEDATGSGWRDHLEITLFAFLGEFARGQIDDATRDWDAIDVIQQAAAVAACDLAQSDEDVRWHGFDSVIDSFDVYPKGDVLTAYARVTGTPSDGWIHAEDRQGWPLSSWRHPASGDIVFLADGINNAEVTCRSYGSPRRLTRPDAP
jgi:hypothetical protein